MNEKSESFKRNVKKHEKKTREFVHINPIKSEIVVCIAISSSSSSLILVKCKIYV